MKIVSFNINGLRARPHQLAALIERHQPDVIGLQETKVADDQFPQAEIEALGYHVHYHGQKGHYGVALLLPPGAPGTASRLPERRRGIPAALHLGHLQRRPGQPDHRDERLLPARREPRASDRSRPSSASTPISSRCWRTASSLEQALVVMGDINISPEDCDIGIGEENRKRWLKTGKCSFLPEEREWLATLKN